MPSIHNSPSRISRKQHRRAEVGLEHDQTADDHERRHEWDEDVAGTGERAHVQLAGEQIRAPQQNRELRELGGLNLQRAEVDPAPGAVDPDTDAGHEHGDQREQARPPASG